MRPVPGVHSYVDMTSTCLGFRPWIQVHSLVDAHLDIPGSVKLMRSSIVDIGINCPGNNAHLISVANIPNTAQLIPSVSNNFNISTEYTDASVTRTSFWARYLRASLVVQSISSGHTSDKTENVTC